jgi:hypothetical protein
MPRSRASYVNQHLAAGKRERCVQPLIPAKSLPASNADNFGAVASLTMRECVHRPFGDGCPTVSGAPRQQLAPMNSIGKEAVVRARKPEMFAQRRPFVIAAEQATALQLGNHMRDEILKPTG